MSLPLHDVVVRTAGHRALVCLVCGHDAGFVRREVLMNTTGMTFLGLDWANAAAFGAVCPRCGFVHTFMGEGLEWTERADTTGDLT